MKLQALQEDFQALLLTEQCQGAAWVAASTGNLSSSERIGIYHNAYRVRLIEVLRENFEHTAVYLGDDWFYLLARSYVEQHPSDDHNISHYGARFADFLAGVLPNDRDVAELAEMDWRLRRAFDGSDSASMTLEDLQQLSAAGFASPPIAFVPTTSIVRHHYNTLDIWHAIDSDGEPPTSVELDQPVDILIWRKGHSPHFRSLSAQESFAIERLLNGDELDRMAQELASLFPDDNVALLIGQFLQRWIADETLRLPAG